MCRVKNCCGFSLRTGCIIIVVLGIIIGLSMLGFIGVKNTRMEGEVNVPGLVIGVVIIIALWLLLLFGVLISNSTVVVIHLIGLILYILFRGVVIFIVLLGITFAGTIIDMFWLEWNTEALIYFIIVMVVMLVGGCLDIYNAVVIGSYYQSLRSGESQAFLPYPV